MSDQAGDPAGEHAAPAPQVLTPPPFPFAPARGLQDLRAKYGAIAVSAGQVIAPTGWESRSMTTITVARADGPHRLYVHRAIAAPLQWALDEAFAACGWRPRTIGCFAPRPKRVNGDLSVHSWGLAVDVDADTNPLAPRSGAPLVTDIPTDVVALFKAAGFTWGGNFPRPDPMHFQFVDGY